MSSKLEWIVGPVHTGKTTRLAERIALTPEKYCGILAPVDSKGNRFLQDLHTGESKKLNCASNAKDAITIGRYTFSKDVFDWAQKILLSHHLHYPDRTLVIDEIGKLELDSKGLAPNCWGILTQRRDLNQHTLIIVRDSLEIRVQQRLKACVTIPKANDN